MRKTALSPMASAHLDMVRGLAALAVMTGHIRGLFFVDYRDLPSPHSGLLQAFYAATGIGQEAVMIFFVLSGFFIGGTVLNTIERWSWKQYLASRLTRLYLVLIPALMLTAVLDGIAKRMPAGHTYFDLPIAHFNAVPLTGRDSLMVFIANLFFQQNILTAAFGSDAPLWSLANEFWYYLLFPMIALIAFAPIGKRQKTATACGALAIGVYIAPSMLGGFAIWLLGVAIHLIPPATILNSRLRKAGAIAAGVIFFAVLFLDRARRLPDNWSAQAVGVAFAVWLFFVVKGVFVPTQAESAKGPGGYAWIAGTLSKCSYSVYAIHMPFVFLIRSSIGAGLWTPSAKNIAMGVLLEFSVFFCGFVFSTLTEAHTMQVRSWVFGLLEGRRSARVAAAV